MRQFISIIILAAAAAAAAAAVAAALVAAGCKADSAPPDSDRLDSRAVNSAPAATAASTSTQPDTRPLIVCFGDSLTAGYGADPGQSYPDYLQTDLDSQGYQYRVVNAGVSGETTKDGVNRLGEVVAMKPSLVIVEFGGNDGLRGLPIADSRANLDAILEKLKASGIQVAIAGITLPPNYGATYIKQFDATYTLLAKKYDLPLMPFLLKDVYGVPGMMQDDQTHATAAGNKVIALDVLKLIAPLLKK